MNINTPPFALPLSPLLRLCPHHHLLITPLPCPGTRPDQSRKTLLLLVRVPGAGSGVGRGRLLRFLGSEDGGGDGDDFGAQEGRHDGQAGADDADAGLDGCPDDGVDIRPRRVIAGDCLQVDEADDTCDADALEAGPSAMKAEIARKEVSGRKR